MSVSSEVSGLCDVTNIWVQKCYEKEEKGGLFFQADTQRYCLMYIKEGGKGSKQQHTSRG